MLPPTCGGSTRNDSAIFHPLVAEWIEDMMVLPEHQFDVHTPLFVQFNCKKVHETRLTWNFPRTWAPFAPSKQNIESVYQPVDFQHFFTVNLKSQLKVWKPPYSFGPGMLKKLLIRPLALSIGPIRKNIPDRRCIRLSEVDATSEKKIPKMKSLGSNPIAMVDTHRLVKFKRPDAV